MDTALQISTERVYSRKAVTCTCEQCKEVAVSLPTLTLTGWGDENHLPRLSWGDESFAKDELSFKRGRLLRMVDTPNGGVAVELHELQPTPDAAGIVGLHLPDIGIAANQAFWLCQNCSQTHLSPSQIFGPA